MKKVLSILLTSVLLLCSQSCGLMKTYNMTKCDFSFQRVTSVSWAGIDFMTKGFDYSLLDLGTIAKCTKAIANKDFTIKCKFDMQATNPGRKEAELVGFDYILYYGEQMLGEGVSLNKSNIVVHPKGGTTTIPVSFEVDLKNLIDIKHPVKSAEKMVDIVGDVSKLGNGETPFAVKIRPHFRVAGKIVKGPFFTVRDN